MADPFAQFLTPPAAAAGNEEMFPGVDSSKAGEDYLKQFPVEIQQGVRDYVNGMTIPTGNPRKTNVVKIVAGKYGNDIGMPADDTTYAARKDLRTQLTKGGPSSMGGQLRNGTTAMDHLAKVAEAAADLGNENILGIAPLSHLWNNARNYLSTDQAAKLGRLQDEAGHYGQEITKFYAGSPGGEAERERFLTALSGAKTPQELAAVIRAEQELIPGKMQQIQEEINTKLGRAGAAEYADKWTEQEAHTQRTSTAVSRMLGLPPPGAAPAQPAGGPAPVGAAPLAPPAQNAPAASAAPPGGYPEGFRMVNPQTGKKIVVQGGRWVPMQ